MQPPTPLDIAARTSERAERGTPWAAASRGWRGSGIAGGSGALVSQGEQAASALDDLAAIPMSDPLHLLAIKVRGPIQRHRPGKLRAPPMLPAKGPPPAGHHPDHHIRLVGSPIHTERQVAGEIPRLLQGIQPAAAAALGGWKVGVTGTPASAGPALGSAARFRALWRPHIAGVPPAG